MLRMCSWGMRMVRRTSSKWRRPRCEMLRREQICQPKIALLLHPSGQLQRKQTKGWKSMWQYAVASWASGLRVERPLPSQLRQLAWTRPIACFSSISKCTTTAFATWLALWWLPRSHFRQLISIHLVYWEHARVCLVGVCCLRTESICSRSFIRHCASFCLTLSGRAHTRPTSGVDISYWLGRV